MKLAYPSFRGARASNDAEIFVLLSFIFLVTEEPIPWPRMENACRCVRLADCFPIACITVAQGSPPLFPSLFRFCLRLFYDFSNDEAAVSSLGVDGNYRRESRVAKLRKQFYFPSTSIPEPLQFLEVSIVDALQRYYLTVIPPIQKY